MTQTNFLELAKTGEPRVIAGLLNRSLQSQGITTKATRRSNELHLLLEGECLADHEASIVTYLDQALSRLQVPAMPIHIYARLPEQEAVLWRHDLNYQGPRVSGLPTMPSNFTLPIPETAQPEMTPDDTQLEQATAFNDFEPDDDVLASEADAGLSFGSVDFLDESPVEERSEDINGEQPDFSFADDYGIAEESNGNGHSWKGDLEELDAPSEAGDLGVPEFEESEVPQKSGLPLVPLSLAAIVALLFAGAGAYYRFFLFDQSSTPIATTPIETTPIATTPIESLPEATPPVSVPSVPPSAPPTSGTEPPAIETLEQSPGTVVEPAQVTSPQDSQPNSAESVNPWRDAINAAMEAARLAQTAQTAQEWGKVAETWDRAVQLLLAVPESDPNYLLAQDKIVEYTNNLDIARGRELKALGQ